MSGHSTTLVIVALVVASAYAVCTSNPPFYTSGTNLPEYCVIVQDAAGQAALWDSALGGYLSTAIHTILDTDDDGSFSRCYYRGVQVNCTMDTYYQGTPPADTGFEIIQPLCTTHVEGKDSYRTPLNKDGISKLNRDWYEATFGKITNPKAGACDETGWVEWIAYHGSTLDGSFGGAVAETQLIPTADCTAVDVKNYLLTHGGYELNRLEYGPVGALFLTVRFTHVGAMLDESIEFPTGEKRSLHEVPEAHRGAIAFWTARHARAQARAAALAATAAAV